MFNDLEGKNKAELREIIEIQIEEHQKLLKRIAELEAFSHKLKEFTNWCLEATWEGSDICGGDCQEELYGLGLLKIEKYDPEKHGPEMSCDIEPGDDVYIRNAWPEIEQLRKGE